MEKILDYVKACVGQIKDKRTGNNKQYTMEEIVMSAYSEFHMQSPSFLDHQKKMEKRMNVHNRESLFGFKKNPTDNHIRTSLDHVQEEECESFFDHVLNEIDLNEWRIDGRLIIAFDGVVFFSSSKISCPHCLKKEHRNGTITFSHSALCSVIVHPHQKRVIPLMPEFIKNEDGFDKQDCEMNSAGGSKKNKIF
ncbi:MAG: ISNCY family transposase ISMae2 [Holosporales bacterium]